ncbi:hypothetical protein [Halosegnis marinus]|uniref:Uncharacterized protein n=1 Tax=Halosegnis marinus TaxID=3034023 RepID=A0ABD5ZMA1_9EURY|nr:hypothetical protein [Halosegnis sp. DT85]
MAMGPQLLVATALSAANAVLLVVLLGVWYRNYRTFESRLTLGLVAFGLSLLVENAVAVYFFFSAASLYGMGGGVGTVVAVMRALQFVALAFLTYVSLE